NGEYKLHLQRALTKASLMMTARGKMLVEQQDYQSAWHAFSQAYSYDHTNEMALALKQEMQNKLGIRSDNDLPRSGEMKPTSAAIGKAVNYKFTQHDYNFQDARLDFVIKTLS